MNKKQLSFLIPVAIIAFPLTILIFIIMFGFWIAINITDEYYYSFEDIWSENY